MTRHIVCYEGDQRIPDQFIIDGALKWLDEKITISTNFDFGIPPIGLATEFRREDDGSITAEIELFEEMPLFDDEWSFSIFMVNAHFDRWKDVLWIYDATIAGVAIIPHAWWPNTPV